MGLRRMRRSPVDILLVLTQFQPLDRLVPIPTSEPSLLQVSRLSSISLSSPSDPPSTVCPRRASHQVIRKRISKVYEEVTILAVVVKNPRHGFANSPRQLTCRMINLLVGLVREIPSGFREG